jgi:hypothetical protein
MDDTLFAQLARVTAAMSLIRAASEALSALATMYTGQDAGDKATQLGASLNDLSNAVLSGESTAATTQLTQLGLHTSPPLPPAP